MAKLTVRVPDGSQNIVSEVVIRAPLERVFAAFTDADLFQKWWARGNPMRVHAFHAVDGGAWHITETSDDGEFSFFGTFHEVTKDTRIIQTFEFLGLGERGHVALERADFDEIEPGVTRVTTTSTYQNLDDLQGMVDGGMEDGYRQSVYALGALLGDTLQE